MYEDYEGKNEIIMCMYSSEPVKTGARNRSRSPKQHRSRGVKKAQKTNYHAKLDEVESIFEKISEKHSGNYTKEKLRTWAHLIQMERHSYDDPPN